MTNNVRLVLSVSEEDRSKLDKLSAELGMNRSQYVRYLLSGCSKLITPSMKYREFVKHFSQIDLSLRVIALKEEVSSEDMLFIESSIKEIKGLLYQGETTFGQVDQKLLEGSRDEIERS